MNVTSADAASPWLRDGLPDGSELPLVASLNVEIAGQIVPNLVATGLGTQVESRSSTTPVVISSPTSPGGSSAERAGAAGSSAAPAQTS